MDTFSKASGFTILRIVSGLKERGKVSDFQQRHATASDTQQPKAVYTKNTFVDSLDLLEFVGIYFSVMALIS